MPSIFLLPYNDLVEKSPENSNPNTESILDGRVPWMELMAY